jgi:hypothetical protein
MILACQLCDNEKHICMLLSYQLKMVYVIIHTITVFSLPGILLRCVASIHSFLRAALIVNNSAKSEKLGSTCRVYYNAQIAYR